MSGVSVRMAVEYASEACVIRAGATTATVVASSTPALTTDTVRRGLFIVTMAAALAD
jgi:hypothetical protein